MNRLLSAIKTDFVVQLRNNLYTIGIVVALFTALVLSYVMTPDKMPFAIPMLMLLLIGGSTLLYVAAMILFEKDEHTLDAVLTSPLKTSEYLSAKVISLTLLATVEAVTMIGVLMLIMSYWYTLSLPNIIILLSGILATGILYTLVGIILIVRYNKITSFFVPVAGATLILQLPLLYFLGIVQCPIFLIIPTAAPAMIMWGAYVSLFVWQWVYAIGYTLVSIIIFFIWAYWAFNRHIMCKGR